MTQTLIKENIEDVKLRNWIKRAKGEALMECINASCKIENIKEEILSEQWKYSEF